MNELEESFRLALLNLSSHKDKVREEATAFLALHPDQLAVEPLIEALKDKANIVRVNAAYGLGEIGDMQAIPALLAAFRSQEESKISWESVLATIVAALVKFEMDSITTETLLECVKSKSAFLQSEIIRHLAAFSDDKALPLLQFLAETTTDVEIKVLSLNVIQKLEQQRDF
jgi:HEAT repeat protein